MFKLVWPWMFLLTPLPLLVYLLVPKAKKSGKLLTILSYQGFSIPTGKQSIGKARLFLLVSIWMLLILAASRPQWITNQVQIPMQGRDLMLAVDLSGSMRVQDMELNNRRTDRLTLTKFVLNQFLDQRQGDRVGLILFGSHAYLQSPLSFDIKTTKTFLSEAKISIAGNQTAIGDAIGLAIKQLQKQKQKQRILILITDGVSNAGSISPEKAAELAAKANIKIYTIALGSEQMFQHTAFGTIPIDMSDSFDTKSLKRIAKLTQGAFFRAKNPDDLQKIYTLINKLQPVEQSSKPFRPTKDLYYWPLAMAMIVSLMMAITCLIVKRKETIL